MARFTVRKRVLWSLLAAGGLAGLLLLAGLPRARPGSSAGSAYLSAASVSYDLVAHDSDLCLVFVGRVYPSPVWQVSFTRSTDGGETWSPAASHRAISPNCPVGL